MEKKIIRDCFLKVVRNDQAIKDKIFGGKDIPSDIDDVTIAISSMDFVDLLIKLEYELGVEFAEKCMENLNVTVKDLIERIDSVV